MNLDEIKEKVYECFELNEWHNKKETDEHWFMSIITILSEAYQSYKNNKHSDAENFISWEKDIVPTWWKFGYELLVTESFEDMCADIFVRVLDFATLKHIEVKIGDNIPELKINLNEEDNISKAFYYMHMDLMRNDFTIEQKIRNLLTNILCLSNSLGFDLMWYIENRIKYYTWCAYEQKNLKNK